MGCDDDALAVLRADDTDTRYAGLLQAHTRDKGNADGERKRKRSGRSGAEKRAPKKARRAWELD